MKLRVFDSTAEVARAAADIVCEASLQDKGLRLGVASGRTTGPLHDELVRSAAEGQLQLAGLELFLLDEYLGLDADDERGVLHTVRRQLAGPLGLPVEALHGPDVNSPDLASACRAYDRLRYESGIDVQILGIGRNGHVAFNEPGSLPSSECRGMELTPETRADNGLGPGDPTHAVTVGLASIMRARRLILIATGPAKSWPLAAAIVHRIESVPASTLIGHPDLVVLADRDAATLVE